MDTGKAGGLLHGEDEEARRVAASLMGKARTEKKAVSSRANGAKSKQVVQSEEHRAKLRAAQAARREREKQEKSVNGVLPPEAQEKRKPGRPKKTEATKAEETQE